MMLTKGHPLMILAIFLSGIVVVLSLRYLVDMTNNHCYPSPLYQAGSFMVGPALQSGYRVFAVRVDKTVSYVYLMYWVKKIMFPVLTRLTVKLLLRAVESVRGQKPARLDKSAEHAQKHVIHLVSPLFYCASSARNRLPNTEGSESRVSGVFGVPTLKDITGSKEGSGMNKTDFTPLSIKRLKNMAKSHTLASVLPLDVIVFQVMQLVTGTTTRPSAPPSSLASFRSAAEGTWDHVDRPSSIPQAEEQLMIISPTNPVAIVNGNLLYSRNEPHQQLTNIASIFGETHSTTASPLLHPQRTYAPIISVVNELLDDDVSTVQSLGPTGIQTPTRALGLNHGVLSEYVRYVEGSPDCSHMIMRSDSGVANRNNIIGEAWPIDGGENHPQPTAVPLSTMPVNDSPGPSPQSPPVSHVEAYRPIFQPLTPHIERFIQAEQPWSPEHQGLFGSARENKLQDDIDKFDAMGL
ncbi:hypothetical protein DFP73DRAFT_56291 [Morchella snyderi]|nr:hypothetical protein DFP73DRAFT_56291 [Morchella snyderi]